VIKILAILDTLTSIMTLILPTWISIILLLILFFIKLINRMEGNIIKNNSGVINCGVCR